METVLKALSIRLLLVKLLFWTEMSALDTTESQGNWRFSVSGRLSFNTVICIWMNMLRSACPVCLCSQ
jgi:hypothetical protein